MVDIADARDPFVRISFDGHETALVNDYLRSVMIGTIRPDADSLESIGHGPMVAQQHGPRNETAGCGAKKENA